MISRQFPNDFRIFSNDPNVPERSSSNEGTSNNSDPPTHDDDDLYMYKNDGDEDDFLPDGPDTNNTSDRKMSKDELIAHQDLFGAKHTRQSSHDKYYAVAKGRIPGIYTDWGTCSKQVNGFSGAVHKGFSNEGVAAAFIAVFDLF